MMDVDGHMMDHLNKIDLEQQVMIEASGEAVFKTQEEAQSQIMPKLRIIALLLLLHLDHIRKDIQRRQNEKVVM